jgi:hypothetical protein
MMSFLAFSMPARMSFTSCMQVVAHARGMQQQRKCEQRVTARGGVAPTRPDVQPRHASRPMARLTQPLLLTRSIFSSSSTVLSRTCCKSSRMRLQRKDHASAAGSSSEKQSLPRPWPHAARGQRQAARASPARTMYAAARAPCAHSPLLQVEVQALAGCELVNLVPHL